VANYPLSGEEEESFRHKIDEYIKKTVKNAV
jgi:hypothetical protein